MMMRPWHHLIQVNNKRGVTLVELLIVIAVIGVALVPASTALLTGMDTFATENDNMQRVYEAQNTVDYITDVVRKHADESINFVANPNEVLDGEGLWVDDRVFYYDGADHTLKELNEVDTSTRVLLENATALDFDNRVYIKKNDVDVLSSFDIAIGLEKRAYGSEVFETTIYLRNK